MKLSHKLDIIDYTVCEDQFVIMGGGRNTPLSSSYPKLVERPVGKAIKNIYQDRLRQFTDRGQYAKQGLLDKLYHKTTNDTKYIKVWTSRQSVETYTADTLL